MIDAPSAEAAFSWGCWLLLVVSGVGFVITFAVMAWWVVDALRDWRASG